MDAKRKVTVLDLDGDGIAAILERRRKADAAAREFNEAQCHTEKTNLLSGRLAMDNDAAETATDVESRQNIRQILEQKQRAIPMEEHGDDAQALVLPRDGHGSMATGLYEQNTTQRHVTSFKHEKNSAALKPPLFSLEEPEGHSVSLFDVSSIKTSKERVKEPERRDTPEAESTVAFAAPTETTGSYFVDEFNRFMDEWLVPREVVPQSGKTETVVPGKTAGYLAQNVQTIQIPSSQDKRQRSSSSTGIDWRTCFATCYGCGGARIPDACPTCKQPVGCAEENRRPSLSRKWTRWVFRQCEEPLDMEAEFLVTPRARLTPAAERDGASHWRVIPPYRTLMLGATQQ